MTIKEIDITLNGSEIRKMMMISNEDGSIELKISKSTKDMLTYSQSCYKLTNEQANQLAEFINQVKGN